MTRKIAIIGSGISGLVCAYLLSDKYEIHLFEANDYLGGHTRTIAYPVKDKVLQLDTGFIVFNKRTYPNFLNIIEKEKIAIEPSEMSFSYQSDDGRFSYNGHSLASLFADRRNLYSLKFYALLADILRFNAQAKKLLKKNQLLNMSVADFLDANTYSDLFKQTYLKPITAAIWSCPANQVLDFPLHFLFGFLENHGLLDLFSRPQWYVIKGGSKTYINALIKKCKDNINLNSPIKKIIRNESGVILVTPQGNIPFDKVIIATHSDIALSILDNPSVEEKSILGSIPYNNNAITLHSDTALLPKIKGNWASWNFRENANAQCCLTYYLNRLQNLDLKQSYLVSVNQADNIDKTKIIKQFNFSHPVFSQQSISAQKRHHEINNKNHTFYCGAYWGYGFHEDGVNSAMKACEPLLVNA
jgi:uncharacterized protein